MQIFLRPVIGTIREAPIPNRHSDPVGPGPDSEISVMFPRSRGSPVGPQPRVSQSRRSEATVIVVRELLPAS
ncbi:hypothetical protein Taro_023037 [Colocasia esculenta]|uniref:Uncharacterized protein n=1 Tax=Colocasia esculenta TaxID=4460 RepID=A0A843V9M7_COLES|nr:hypothetical protein [Colocasia esculenta]